MSSNPLIMGYGGGDFTAAGCRAGGRAAALSLCMQAVGGAWPAWRLVQWRQRIRGVQYTVCAIQIDVLTFYLF